MDDTIRRLVDALRALRAVFTPTDICEDDQDAVGLILAEADAAMLEGENMLAEED